MREPQIAEMRNVPHLVLTQQRRELHPGSNAASENKLI